MSGTPATKALDKAKIAYQTYAYEHDEKASSYGVEAAEKVGVPAEKIFKTLAVSDGKQLYVGIVPVLKHLNLKALAKSLGVKKLAMADPKIVSAKTGYIMGGVSPLGQKTRLPMRIDSSAEALDIMLVSGGKRGFDVGLAPQALAKITAAKFAAIAED